MKKKFIIYTLGCKANSYESQAYLDQLKTLGCSKTDLIEEADFCIINGCAVTQKADKKTLLTIKSLKNKNPKIKFFVTGCISKDILQKIDFEINVISNNLKQSLVSQIFPSLEIPEFKIKNFDNHTRAFVKIQDGCNNFCSYCTIPLFRGKEKTSDSSKIINEIKDLVANGYKEIVLTGINLGAFKSDISFVDLLKRIEDIEGLKRFKLSSLNPEHVTDEIISFFKESKKLIHYLHLSLQSGSNNILKLMRRKYTQEDYLEKTQMIVNQIPDFTFQTDLIVGFPNESEKDFLDSLDVLKKVSFTKVHVFPYSKRNNTLASKMDGHLDFKTIDERKKIATELAQKIAIEKRQKFLNREFFALFEKLKDNHFMATTSNNLSVKVEKLDEIRANALLKVKLYKNEKDYLLAKLCK